MQTLRGEARASRGSGRRAHVRARASPCHLSKDARAPRQSEAGPRKAGRAARCRRGEAECALPEAHPGGEAASARSWRFATTPEERARITSESEARTRVAGPKASGAARRGDATRPVRDGWLPEARCPRRGRIAPSATAISMVPRSPRAGCAGTGRAGAAGAGTQVSGALVMALEACRLRDVPKSWCRRACNA